MAFPKTSAQDNDRMFPRRFLLFLRAEKTSGHRTHPKHVKEIARHQFCPDPMGLVVGTKTQGPVIKRDDARKRLGLHQVISKVRV
jgi:hypothetical protein